jgi:CheY-like chemotaxis protein
MSNNEQKISVRNEKHQLPSQDTEGATRGGPLRGRVLIVDDEPFMRKLISRHLVAAGYVVREAEDGLDAIEKLRAGPLDLIISDLNMPRMTGFEFLDVVRKRFPQIPVIVISGFAVNELPEDVPADAYFPKNEFLYEQLLQTVPALTSKPPPRTAPPSVDNEIAEAKWDGNGRVIIRCEDCLREFTVPRVFRMGQDEAWTACVHCGRFARIHVVEKSEGC